LPGLKPEEMKVEVTDDAIVIEGERRHETEGKEGGRWHSERRYGHFYRAIPLPDGADADQIRAEFRNGELHVTVPVQQSQSKRRQIPIKGPATEGQHER
jgi:HSP20 family protein